MSNLDLVELIIRTKTSGEYRVVGVDLYAARNLKRRWRQGTLPARFYIEPLHQPELAKFWLTTSDVIGMHYVNLCPPRPTPALTRPVNRNRNSLRKRLTDLLTAALFVAVVTITAGLATDPPLPTIAAVLSSAAAVVGLILTHSPPRRPRRTTNRRRRR